MRFLTEKICLENGQIIRKRKDMRAMFNLNILNLLEKAQKTDSDMPVLLCDTKVYPDFLALYNQPRTYHETKSTAVCFYSYDSSFDGINGLFNAIYYNNNRLLSYYKERFHGVKYFISPDYSVFGDFPEPENLIRLWKARIVTLWFALELRAVAIPSATYISENTFPKYFDGLEKCSVIAFSTKGHVRYASERNLLKAAVKYAVDNLPLQTIIVYSVCGEDQNSFRLFKYAINKGIKVIIPNNILRKRNIERRGIH